jgi:hypothetical protein
MAAAAQRSTGEAVGAHSKDKRFFLNRSVCRIAGPKQLACH